MLRQNSSVPASRRTTPAQNPLQRPLLLVVVLLAFGRLLTRLEAKNLWWDESLSLQRAESDWLPLLAGRMVQTDGIGVIRSLDQHPFGFFALLKLLINGAGQSEFVLRFPAVAGALLLVPALWVLAQLLARRSVLPPQAAPIAALLAAIHPFFLWYGQEARGYTLLAFFAIISTYLLLRWRESGQRGWFWGYGAAALGLISIHYFSVLLLPLHALVIFGRLARRHRGVALGLAAAIALVSAAVSGVAAWRILQQPNSGANFQPIALDILVPDLINAFSLGLSVDIDEVWWLDLVFAATAAVGLGYGLRRRSIARRDGWLLPIFLLGPVVLLLLINQVQPAYMNARHLSLISGFFLLLVAGGVAAAWRAHLALGGALLLLLAGGMIASSVNYHVDPAYDKDDFAAVGHYLQQEIMPGDLLLLNPPDELRLYRYYLPVDELTAAAEAGAAVGWRGVPLLGFWEQTEETLPALLDDYRRAWLVTSGMYPFADPERRVEAWLNQNAFRIRQVPFSSTTSTLTVQLYLLQEPLRAAPPPEATPLDIVFGETVRLVAYRVEAALPHGPVPITFYWQAAAPLDQRYKYRAEIRRRNGAEKLDGSLTTEREPYDGFFPTSLLPTDGVVEELSQIWLPPLSDADSYALSLTLYNAETLEVLPVRTGAAQRAESADDGHSVLLDLPVTRINLR